MPKSRMRPPRTPRGESVKVTLANYDLQIRNLTTRCTDLVESRDAAMTRASRAEMDLATAHRNLANEMQFRSADLMRLTEAKAEILRLEAMMEGYRLHAKDVAGLGSPIRPPSSLQDQLGWHRK